MLKFAGMLYVESFTFNPFQENTYIVYNDQNNCIIFDPGMYQASEEYMFSERIKTLKLNPVYLVNTHCHIDHIFGNTFCVEKYGIPLLTHSLEAVILNMGKASAHLYGLNYNESVKASDHIDQTNTLRLGKDVLEIRFTPGHSPGSLSFYSHDANFIIVGDALFHQSIGRTDLPGGNYNTLLDSINNQLLVLPDETKVYSGHGPETTVGHERMFNPFLMS